MFEEKPCQFEAIARIKPKPTKTPPKTNNALMKFVIFESFEYLERIFSACSPEMIPSFTHFFNWEKSQLVLFTFLAPKR